jgi:hypothetical protein
VVVRLERNIDLRGRIARGISGLLFLIVAVVLVFAGAEWRPVWLRWVLCGLGIVFGAFQIFGAVIGWCVTRALGFRTPM